MAHPWIAMRGPMVGQPLHPCRLHTAVGPVGGPPVGLPLPHSRRPTCGPQVALPLLSSRRPACGPPLDHSFSPNISGHHIAYTYITHSGGPLVDHWRTTDSQVAHQWPTGTYYQGRVSTDVSYRHTTNQCFHALSYYSLITYLHVIPVFFMLILEIV